VSAEPNPGDQGRHRFNNSAFVNTLTLDNAIAAPATTGFR
jgi:hypothetical protein